MQQIDMNSDEFQAEMEKTSQFVEKSINSLVLYKTQMKR
jgi:hypothetical protein